jgi:uncharacterized protein with ParB-like and HNH nuclease domain
MKTSLFDTSTVTFSDIVSNSKIYKVPIYQRDYSWKEEHWEDLWNDIILLTKDSNKDKQNHYLGSIVLQTIGDKVFQIIDGQQRIATISFIALAVLKNIQSLIEKDIEKESNIQRYEILRTNFLGSKDATSLNYSSKLFLNENNNGFYQGYLLQLKPPINQSRLTDSEKLMWKAFQYFDNKIQNHFKDNFSGKDLAEFLEQIIAERLIFIQIVVEDELSAYTVFETLNARGLRLTVTDLLKNYLFSIAVQSQTDLSIVKNQWNRIIQMIDLDNFPTFLRHYWNSRNNLIRAENLFKTIRRSITTPEEVFNLLDNLEKNAGIYIALSNPADEIWQSSREQRKRIRELELFRIKQCFPLLLTSYEKLPVNEFNKVLRVCSIISFRYNVIGGLNPNIMEEAYNKASIKIYNDILKTSKDIFNEIKDIYINDEEFKNSFSSKIISSKRTKMLVRYILFEIENQIALTDKNFEDDPGTIEHILPENPDDSWNYLFPDDIQIQFIYRLGNYTLLESKKNNECQNKNYAYKSKVYQTSQYNLSKIITYQEWNQNSIKGRQQKLSDYATAIWKINDQ